MADVRRCLGPLFVLLVLIPSAATAHSNWVETDPEEGTSLTKLPAEATVTVSEEPQKADAVLARPDGKVDNLKAQIVGSTIKVKLPATGPRGAYTLSYRVVSADGHPVSGSTTFTVTTGPAPSAEAPATPTPTPTPTPHATAEAARGPLVPIAIGVAILGVAVTVFAARSMRR